MFVISTIFSCIMVLIIGGADMGKEANELAKSVVSAVLSELRRYKKKDPNKAFMLLDLAGNMVTEIRSCGPLIACELLKNDGVEYVKLYSPSTVTFEIREVKNN